MSLVNLLLCLSQFRIRRQCSKIKFFSCIEQHFSRRVSYLYSGTKKKQHITYFTLCNHGIPLTYCIHYNRHLSPFHLSNYVYNMENKINIEINYTATHMFESIVTHFNIYVLDVGIHQVFFRKLFVCFSMSEFSSS